MGFSNNLLSLNLHSKYFKRNLQRLEHWAKYSKLNCRKQSEYGIVSSLCTVWGCLHNDFQTKRADNGNDYVPFELFGWQSPPNVCGSISATALPPRVLLLHTGAGSPWCKGQLPSSSVCRPALEYLAATELPWWLAPECRSCPSQTALQNHNLLLVSAIIARFNKLM